MSCQEIQNRIIAMRSFSHDEDAQLTDETRQHVAQCSGCQKLLQTDTQFDALLHQVIHQVSAPESLESGIQWRLRQQRRARQRSRTLYWSLSAAAALLLAVSVNWYLNRPYDLSSLAVSMATLDRQHNAVSFEQLNGLQKIELIQWLKRNGFSSDIPSRIKLEHLTGASVVVIGGRKVPVLELKAGGAISRVCLLQRRFFDEKKVKQLKDDENLSSFVVTDRDDAASVGWMIVERGSAHLFIDGFFLPDGA